MAQSEDNDGPWVPGFPDDHLQRWVDDGVPPPHHEKWDEAVQVALDWKTRKWDPGDAGELVLEYQVQASKKNPGWIDGYRVVLRP